jgi:hypothetical protein
MAQMVILVIDDPNKTVEVLRAWMQAGATGTTILNSTGLAHHLERGGARDDLPLIPGLSSLLRSREEPHRTLWAVVPDDFEVERLVQATESVTGPLHYPDTGIMFVVPVLQVWGLVRDGRQDARKG